MNKDSTLDHEVVLVRELLDGVLAFLRDSGFDDDQIVTLVRARLRFIGFEGLRVVEEDAQ